MTSNELHMIKPRYKTIAICKEVKCLCGDVYKEHKTDTIMVCPDCDERLVFDVYSLKQYDDEGLTEHGIGYCKKCNGVDLQYYTNAQYFLGEFRKGKKVIEYQT